MSCKFFFVGLLSVLLHLPVSAQSSSAGEIPRLVDVTQSAGLGFHHSIGDDAMDNIVESTGAGVLVFDYDQDGNQDIYFVNGCYMKAFNHPKGRVLQGKLRNQLFRNNGDGTFSDQTSESGLGDMGYGMSAIAGDFDNDGDPDVFITNYGPNRFYLNLGNGKFKECSKEYGLDDSRWGVGCTWLDFDADGVLDLYVGNYLLFDPEYRLYYPADNFPGPLSYPGEQDLLYKGRAVAPFVDVTEKYGINSLSGRTMGVAACDIDGDGDVDIFAANDAMENYLWINEGNAAFTNMALISGTAFGQNGEATSAMGPEFGDLNRDGFMDLLVPDMLYGCLYQNDGKGAFSDLSATLGLGMSLGQYVSWSGNFIDINNDGYLDIFISNGDAHRMEPEEDLVFLNQEGKKLVNVSDQCGKDFQQKFLSRGSAAFDFDNDGDLDLVEMNINDRPRLLRNDLSKSNHWLDISLTGTKSNRDAYGAKVKLHYKLGKDDVSQIMEKRCSSGYLSQGDSRLHFGLGPCSEVDYLEISWPSGKVQKINHIKADQTLSIVEPAS